MNFNYPNKSYNNIIERLCQIAESHNQITTVSVGDIFDIDIAKNTKFPLLHINPTSVQTGASELMYSFQIFIMDLVSEKDNWQTYQQLGITKLVDTKNNQQEVFSETLQIATDIISLFQHSEYQTENMTNINDSTIYITTDNFTLEPFQEKYDNLLTGWVFNLEVSVMNDFNSCAVPLEK